MKLLKTMYEAMYEYNDEDFYSLISNISVGDIEKLYEIALIKLDEERMNYV